MTRLFFSAQVPAPSSARAPAHPYRSAHVTTTTSAATSAATSLEEVSVWTMLSFVGVLGVAVGILEPSHSVEPSIGLCILVFVGGALATERRHRRERWQSTRASSSGQSCRIAASSLALFARVLNTDDARAENESAPVVPATGSAAFEPPSAAAGGGTTPSVEVTPTSYVEAYYAYNLHRPSNGITNVRGFDNRHDTFTLGNVAFGADWKSGPVGGRLVLQVGSTPSSYYSGEPVLAGASGANASSAELWKYLQEAFVTYRAPLGRGLFLQLGLVASPIGLEAFAVKDNWNWSRSNLFVGLPYYHTGLRARYDWTNRLSTTVSVFNGWNSVVDGNEEKSVQANVTYDVAGALLLQALYFGGVERTAASPEGPSWRHHFDTVARVDATSWLSVAAQGDYGWETNRLGTAHWFAGALYARLALIEHVYLAFRGDRFHEDLAVDADGRASAPLFWGGVGWVSSGTVTVDVRPHERLSVRLEYRHDAAEAPLFFDGRVSGDGTSNAPYIPNARTQDTVLVGGTAWF